MNWKKALGFGVLIWIVIFVLASAFMAYGLESGTLFNVLLTILCLISIYIVARYIAPASYGIALQYGLAFAVIGIVLDYLITAKFAPYIFSSVYYWVGYVLSVFVPLLAVKKTMVQAQPSQPQQ
ncbi:MAG: hypothetical protein UW07_C0039G0009 [Candidatus Nomurabacteria bacterium GW2011_GWF2_43_8]|uniref:Uncharacterized protein n=3 Tax=Candidatus Nomuraibacteriota TaxID=1752729 RepID=A0A0G1FIW0_9BACT|nr:MAG: hypothetical protein UV76_C0001G0022 [Candidatus Nomurabacteria bacterium GW2011_GWA2_43_15]KKT19219.1 MAG: hypothetical protein UW02_C0013G0002 [Candidatus Nomurabacteria bacterium GW2011_GWB1_43_7]KKT22301.1 MAG: hypothetical protein UW07_C0039G0009 [Candidatus Nomurabacteria bacterium GW2011_GWF2_43_8]